MTSSLHETYDEKCYGHSDATRQTTMVKEWLDSTHLSNESEDR